MKLYRIENWQHRGPFQQGLTAQWRDGGEKPLLLPPWVAAGMSVAEFQSLFSEHATRRGIACRTREQLHQWFSRAERRRLKRLGFHEVELVTVRILLETPTQVVFEILPPFRAGCDVEAA
jgi:hypothetical protein